jgi:uncharacterized membrane protein YecN with MAPEG domain
LLAFVLIVPSFRVNKLRQRGGISLGDGGDEMLYRAMWGQGIN